MLYHRTGLLGALALVGCSTSPPGTTPDAGASPDAAATSWEKVVGDGFGSAANSQITEFQEYGGFLYAGTGRAGAGSAEVWRSASGNAASWAKVDGFTPPLNGGSVTSFATTTLGGGFIWLGISGSKGATTYRSKDGNAWVAISEGGFGTASNVTAAPHMVLFKGPNDTTEYLYAGVGSHGGTTAGQVWRTPYENSDPSKWKRLVDFATEDPTVTTITYFYTWKDKLYFTTTRGQLWESTDGVNFSKNQGVGDGFGTSTIAIACLVDFQGYLYAATTNKTLGGQLWRTSDGDHWTAVTSDAFGKGPKVEELHNIRVSFGQLWVTAYTNVETASPSPIWASSDGLAFVQSNTDGFGDPNNMGPNPVTVGYGDHQYHGGPNSVTGAQIWRLRVGK